MKKGGAAKITSGDVLLYYPNLIGYFRIACMWLSFYFAQSNWKASVICYSLAFVGDVVDGYVARAFKQSSTYGGILDMVTDRVSTCGLLVVLSTLYPTYAFYFTSLIVIDIFSHWFHVMSVSGHHKSKDSLLHRNPLLQWYYSIYPLFGYCCVGTEVFYILLYILHFYQNETIEKICYFGCLPACILKQLVNIVQFTSAAECIAAADAKSANK